MNQEGDVKCIRLSASLLYCTYLLSSLQGERRNHKIDRANGMGLCGVLILKSYISEGDADGYTLIESLLLGPEPFRFSSSMTETPHHMPCVVSMQSREFLRGTQS